MEERQDEERLSLAEGLGRRQRLLDIAFWMLGATDDAEDVVRETYIRWYRLTEAERTAVEAPQVWLTRVAAQLCLDLLGTARRGQQPRTEEWLSAPVRDLEARAAAIPVGPPERITFDGSASRPPVVMLETLTPAERVAFVLHDIFALPLEEIGVITGRTPQICRELACSARRRIRVHRRRTTASDDIHNRIAAAFQAACGTDDLTALVPLLAPDVAVLSDGGGTFGAPQNPVRGADRSARFILDTLSRYPERQSALRSVNGKAGLVLCDDGIVFGIVSFDVRDERITDVWLVVNPDKLRSWNRS
ncbi:sigma factor [Peterkaempfera sp. SMS 1(5)a]|uniref:sigma factor n=1 Tax=Peterkaempfera podocarpi TaxID=3232308 RepID=UPI00366E6A47